MRRSVPNGALPLHSRVTLIFAQPAYAARRRRQEVAREANAAIAFFTEPTVTFRLPLPHCFFAINHGRRRIPLNVTEHPTVECVALQLREAFSVSG